MNKPISIIGFLQAAANPKYLLSLLSNRQRLSIVICLFLASLGAVTYRTATKFNAHGPPTKQLFALEDFGIAVYYPARALLDGRNPYGTADYAPYSPLMIVFHAPFAFFPYNSSAACYYLLTIIMTLVLARITVVACGLQSRAGAIYLIAALILISRPGCWNITTGQVAVPFTIASYAALLYGKDRYRLAGLGLAFATMKPTFGLPLVILMLAGRAMRALRYGLGLAIIFTGLATVWIVHNAGGVKPFAKSVLDCYSRMQQLGVVYPPQSRMRIDTVALISRLAGHSLGLLAELTISCCLLALGAITVYRLSKRDDVSARILSITVACLTMLTCTYHQAYDLLLLVLPTVAFAANVASKDISAAFRWTILSMLIIVQFNYLNSSAFLSLFQNRGLIWLVATSINGAVLLVTLFFCVMLAWKPWRCLREGAAVL